MQKETIEEFLAKDAFHSIAAACFAIVAAESGQWPPDSETVRKMAYSEYEKAIGGRERHPPIVTDCHAEDSGESQESNGGNFGKRVDNATGGHRA